MISVAPRPAALTPSHGWRNRCYPRRDRISDPQTDRTRLANERTFLAWLGTALAVMEGGAAIGNLFSPLEIAGGRRLVGAALILLGGGLGFVGYARWIFQEQSDRGLPIISGRGPHLLASAIVLICAIALATMYAR